MEPAPYEVAVLTCCDHALSLHAMATGTPQDLAGHVTIMFAAEAAVWISCVGAQLKGVKQEWNEALFKYTK